MNTEQNIFNSIAELLRAMKIKKELTINTKLSVKNIKIEAEKTYSKIESINARFLLDGEPLSWDLVQTLDSDQVVYCFIVEKDNKQAVIYIGETGSTFCERHKYTLTATLGKHVDTDFRLLMALIIFLQNGYSIRLSYFQPISDFYGTPINSYRDIERELIKNYDPIVNYDMRRFKKLLIQKNANSHVEELIKLYIPVCKELENIKQNGYNQHRDDHGSNVTRINNNVYALTQLLG